MSKSFFTQILTFGLNDCSIYSLHTCTRSLYNWTFIYIFYRIKKKNEVRFALINKEHFCFFRIDVGMKNDIEQKILIRHWMHILEHLFNRQFENCSILKITKMQCNASQNIVPIYYKSLYKNTTLNFHRIKGFVF